MRISKFLSLLPLVAIVAATFPAGALAANSVGVQPLRTEIEISPGQTITRELTVLNRADEPTDVIPEVEALLANDPQGFPIVTSDVRADDTQNVVNWLSISKKPITVPAGGKVTIPFAITAPANTEPGGRYAAINYVPLVPISSDGGVTVRVRTASLLLVTVRGNLVEKVDLARFGPEGGVALGGETLTLETEVKNAGTIHSKPSGRIVIRDEAGTVVPGVGKVLGEDGKEKAVDYLPVNERAGNVLPGSERIFPAVWEHPLFGQKYTAELTLSYAPSQPEITQTFALDLRRKLIADDVSVDWVDGGESTFRASVKNDGATRERTGLSLVIKNVLGYVLDEVPIEVSEDILPGASREITVPYAKRIPTGEYTAEFVFNGETIGEADFGASGAWWRNPLVLMGGGFGLVILILGGVILRLVRRQKLAA